MCPSCKYQTIPDWYFCPNCGKVLKEKPLVLSIAKQALIYSVSFFLTPLGLVWGVKYIRSKGKKARMVGFISIILTILSIILLLEFSKGFMDQYSKILNNSFSF